MQPFDKAGAYLSPWAPPLISSDHIECDLCSYAWREDLKKMTIKHRNSYCFMHRIRDDGSRSDLPGMLRKAGA